MIAPRYTLNCAHCGAVVDSIGPDEKHSAYIYAPDRLAHQCQDVNNARETHGTPPAPNMARMVSDLRHYPPPSLWQTISAEWPYVAGGALLLTFAAACALALWWFVVTIFTLT